MLAMGAAEAHVRRATKLAGDRSGSVSLLPDKLSDSKRWQKKTEEMPVPINERAFTRMTGKKSGFTSEIRACTQAQFEGEHESPNSPA
jgi:hypothetical protein